MKIPSYAGIRCSVGLTDEINLNRLNSIKDADESDIQEAEIKNGVLYSGRLFHRGKHQFYFKFFQQVTPNLFADKISRGMDEFYTEFCDCGVCGTSNFGNANYCNGCGYAFRGRNNNE